MKELIPSKDPILTVDTKNIISVINRNINQSTIDKNSLFTNLKLLIHTDTEDSVIRDLLLNCTKRLINTINNCTSTEFNIIDEVLSCVLETNTNYSFIDTQILDTLCILYLKSVKFNFSYFLQKARIHEKHRFKISNFHSVEIYNINSLSLLINNFYKNSIDDHLKYIRIFIVGCLLKVNISLPFYDIFYFIHYTLLYDSTTIINWINKSPKSVSWNILGIKNIKDFPFTELRYIKNINILERLRSNIINHRFIDYIYKHSKQMNNLISKSHTQDTKEYTILICDYIIKKDYLMYIKLIKNLIIIDKQSFNRHFINNIKVVDKTVIDIFRVNYKLIKICNIHILLEIMYNSNVVRLLEDYKIFKYFIKRLGIYNMKYISKYITDIKKIIYIYKYYDIIYTLFFDRILKIIEGFINEMYLINKGYGDKDKGYSYKGKGYSDKLMNKFRDKCKDIVDKQIIIN